MGLKTSISLDVSGVLSFTMDAGPANFVHKLAAAYSLADGTSDGQADEIWSDTRTVNAAANDDLELDNLSQTTTSAAALRSPSFAVVKGVFIQNTSDADYMTMGGVGSTAFAGTGYPLVDDSDLTTIKAGGFFAWYDPAGVAVTNGATDVLRLSGVTSNQTYKIVIVGESA